MRTTLNLDESLIRELMAATRARTKTDAITLAISELIRRKKLDKLRGLSGKLRLQLDRERRERRELRRQRTLLRQAHGPR